MEVSVFYADVSVLSDPHLYSEAYSIMPAGRRTKIDRFVFLKDRLLSLGAGLLLRRVLSGYGIDYSDADIRSDVNGKPFVCGYDISFNLSHSGTKVLCAVSDSDVGCDVEMIKDIEPDIARRFFFASEYEGIMSAGPGRTEMFYRYWTLKESFMKATGLGLSLPLDSFEIIMDDGIAVRQDVDDRCYIFREFDMHDGYRYAVCSVGREIESRMKAVDLSGF